MALEYCYTAKRIMAEQRERRNANDGPSTESLRAVRQTAAVRRKRIR
jgi:hypothetical protein